MFFIKQVASFFAGSKEAMRMSLKKKKIKLYELQAKEGSKLFDFLPPNVIPMHKALPPFIPFQGGFGYRGVLLYDTKKRKVQCHFCGKWFAGLGKHVRKHNKISGNAYKDVVGLFRKQSLSSPGLTKKWSRQAKKRFRLRGSHRINKFSAHPSKGRLMQSGAQSFQNMNRFGTCEAQLKARLDDAIKKFGRVPKVREEPALAAAMTRRFGNFRKGVEHFGYIYPKPSPYEGSALFYKHRNESPHCVVCGKKMYRVRYRKTWQNIHIFRKRKFCSKACREVSLITRKKEE